MNNPFLHKVLLLVLLTTFVYGSRAQDKVEAQIPPGMNRVYLMNKNKISLNIFLSYDGKKWTKEILIPRAITPFRMNQAIFIKVYTSNSVYVQYPLKNGTKYSIEYDDKNQKWEVYEIVNSDQ